MTDSTRPDRRNIKYIAVVVLGSLVLGMGINLLLVYTGVVTGDSFKANATVVSCTSDQCSVTYDRAGTAMPATLQGSAQDYEAGAGLKVTVYNSDLAKAYPERVVPLGFALTILVVGLMITTFGGVRLFRFWRNQARAQGALVSKDAASSNETDVKDTDA